MDWRKRKLWSWEGELEWYCIVVLLPVELFVNYSINTYFEKRSVYKYIWQPFSWHCIDYYCDEAMSKVRHTVSIMCPQVSEAQAFLGFISPDNL